MVVQLQTSDQQNIIYPDSDGQPMADNTKQFRWIVLIQQNLGRERQRAEQERQRADLAEQRAARLAEQLRAMGIDPDQT